MKRGRTPLESPVNDPKSETVPKPQDLDEVAEKAWDSVIKDLQKLGTVHKTDAKLIELYARSQSLFVRVENQLSIEPLTFSGDKGRKFINPLANLYPVLLAKQRQILSDLGLTPSTRKGDGGEDDLGEFLRNRGS